MKEFLIAVSVGAFSALLFTVGHYYLSASRATARTAEAEGTINALPSRFKMTCAFVDHAFRRCENAEVVCYDAFSRGLQCFSGDQVAAAGGK